MSVAPEVPDLAVDLHVHSTFSDDAHSTIAENLGAAAERGLREIRCLEHVRRDTRWVPGFVTALAAAARDAHPDLVVCSGVEAKILDARGTVDAPDDLVGIDAVVIADHRFPGPDEPWSPRETRMRLAGGLGVTEALDLLVSGLVAAMHSVRHGPVGLAQLAHCFSILPKVGLCEDDLTDLQLERWADAAAETGTIVEVNEKWACPGPRALRAARAAGAALAPATDSHVCHDVGRYRVVADLWGAGRGADR